MHDLTVAAANTPPSARMTKNEYWSGMKDASRLKMPKPKRPVQKTSFADHRSLTRPQKGKKQPNGRAYEF